MLRIYGTPISVHTRKAIVAAIAKDLPHEVVPVVPVLPGNPPANWRTLSPTGKIPALQDGEFTVCDSAAICLYMERLQPQPPLYPREARAFAKTLELEQYAGTLFREVVHPLFHETVVHPKIRGIPTDVAKVDDVLRYAAPEHFGTLDRVAWDGDLTVAHVAVASNVVTYRYLGFDPMRADFPALAALVDRVIAHPAFREALAREVPVVKAMGLHVQDW
ncbi:MAG TPA: glutathione S-transferase family protein [Burkholderiales bacterium]|nr:glutathione S-transferase family protein [Burkholderiales bacterium]